MTLSFTLKCAPLLVSFFQIAAITKPTMILCTGFVFMLYLLLLLFMCGSSGWIGFRTRAKALDPCRCGIAGCWVAAMPGRVPGIRPWCLITTRGLAGRF